jgi:hypothetical protein
MRAYILTKNERTIIENYLTNLEYTNDLHVLIHRIKNSYVRLSEDIKLIHSVLERRKIEI